MFFLHHFNPSFLTQTLELSIAISTYRDICCERILGNQSVVITKVRYFYLRRQTCRFALFRVLVRTRCRGVASASLHVFVLAGMSEGTRESKSSSENSL